MRPYHREAAVHYALAWALGRNPAYPNFGFDPATGRYGGGGDCANFISQALHAGGWGMTGNHSNPMHGSYDRRYWVPCPASHGGDRSRLDPSGDDQSTWVGWWATPKEASERWASVKKLTDLIDHLGLTKNCLREDLEPGDLVTFNKFGQHIHHIVMITGKRSGFDGDELLYSGHSTDRLNYPLALAEEENRGSTFLYWKILLAQ